jgi:hypothetical protein
MVVAPASLSSNRADRTRAAAAVAGAGQPAGFVVRYGSYAWSAMRMSEKHVGVVTARTGLAEVL